LLENTASGQEQRFRADINHIISKNIVSSLNPGDTIVLEELTGIRNKRLRKAQRTLLNNWSYFQLEQFITYKAMAKGIDVKHIDARYTSQRCSKCALYVSKQQKIAERFLLLGMWI
jgi:putative transposase